MQLVNLPVNNALSMPLAADQLEGISVIICCYNSANRIRPTMEHLSKQMVSKGIAWEIIVVDNNSNDETAGVARAAWDYYGGKPDLKVLTETKQGLSFARQSGVFCSRYEYIVFCDDDNWLAPDYLQNAFELLNSKPDVGIAGGWSKAVTDGELPASFKRWQYTFAVGKPHQQSKDITDGWQVWGAGMVARRSILIKIFSENYPLLCADRTSNQLGSGGDDEICSRTILLGYRLFYSTRLNFSHFISRHRLTSKAIAELQAGFKESNHHLKRYQFCIEGLWLHQQKNWQSGLVSLAKAVLNYTRGQLLHGRCHLDSFAFCFRMRALCDKTSRLIFDFTNDHCQFNR
ncbi:MAG: glycosyltransferase [Bacteroidota bacterium]